ncbi:g3028 [Coccomyxa viridis]|uniref:G3028 protein n=1 Tax=Coccomyxa viridis TaxID=1274662 RepID=A0ABP1FLU5_9CHLO
MTSPSVDRTADFWQGVQLQAAKSGLTEEKLRKLKSAQILRSLAQKTSFGCAAVEVAKNINALKAFVRGHQRDYVQAGRCSEAERDRIEEQVGLYMRSCTDNIARLEGSLAPGQPGAQNLNPHGLAHRHGVALILSERLQAAGTTFDRCRSVRYQQLLQQQRQLHQKKQRLNAIQGNSAYRPELEPGQQSQAWAQLPQEQQQALEAENQALVNELSSLNQSARGIESTMRELAQLSQMFSAQVMHQAEQIEQLYQQAVKATVYTEKGNVSLGKAIKASGSASNLLIWFIIFFAAALLFFDWFHS